MPASPISLPRLLLHLFNHLQLDDKALSWVKPRYLGCHYSADWSDRSYGFYPWPYTVADMPIEIAYLFIDGGYLRKRYADAMRRVFGDDGEIDVGAVRSWLWNRFGSSVIPRRAFYYDCLHDVQLDSETEQQFRARVDKQKAEFQRIQSLSGFHVRLGRLTGRGGNVRQKGVDVLLAVEMLDNAFRKNMDEIWLLAGDADFVPLIEAVTRLGTWVNVFYDAHAASRELYSAADQGIEFKFADAYSWGTQQTRQRCRLPEQLDFRSNHRAGLTQSSTVIRGKDETGHDYLCGKSANQDQFILALNTADSSIAFRHERVDVLKSFGNEYFGRIAWTAPQREA
jgi:uncharacterized LabA/DUF88 family protein